MSAENRRMTQAAGVVGAATLLSRLLGFVRDVAIAWLLGAGLGSDAFFVAFRIPNLLRRLFAEGSLTLAFVPVFSEYLTRHGRREAFAMALSAFRSLSVVLAFAAVVGIVFSVPIVWVTAPGFAAVPEKLHLTVVLTRLMFPYIFFIGLVALCMGILNALGHFAAPALAPVMLNLSMITAAFFLAPRMNEPAVGLAVGVLAGGMLQLLLQMPFLFKKGLLPWRKAVWFHPGIKRVVVLMAPTILGSAVYQVNILVGTLLASLLPEGSVSYLYYADRLIQFPLGIFAVAAATAVLPSLSRQAAAEDKNGVVETFEHALKLVMFITVPAMVGLIVLREPIVALLFGRGAFDRQTVGLTAYALLYYGVGLWAFSAVRIVVSTFYALQDTRTPVRAAIISMAFHLVLGIVLMQWLAHGGLALATSVASMLNLGILMWYLKKRFHELNMRGIFSAVLKTGIRSVAMGGVVWVGALFLIPKGEPAALNLFFGLSAAIVMGICCYFLLARWMKSAEMAVVVDAVQRGLERR